MPKGTPVYEISSYSRTFYSNEMFRTSRLVSGIPLKLAQIAKNMKVSQYTFVNRISLIYENFIRIEFLYYMYHLFPLIFPLFEKKWLSGIIGYLFSGGSNEAVYGRGKPSPQAKKNNRAGSGY